MDSGQLFKGEYVNGNMESIDTVASVLGTIGVFIISIVGFGIVLATLAKNALHGLYAVFPKFFDKVDAAKKASLGMSSAQGGNQISKGISSISMVLLNLCPNVKAMTDFEDEVLDAKAYFMRAIPLACIQIFIGVFIFFGYPAKVAEAASRFGTGVFDVVLTNVDPTAWVQSLPGQFVILDLATDGSDDSHDKVINDVTREAYKSYIGIADDVLKERRVELAREIESWVMTQLDPYTQYTDEDAYSYTLSSMIVDGEPNLSNRDGSGDGTKNYTISKAVEMTYWDSGTAKDVSGKYLVFTLQFKKKAVKTTSLTAVDNTATVPSSKVTTNASKGTVTVAFSTDTSSASLYAISGATGSLVLSNGTTVSCYVTVSGGNAIFTAKYSTDYSKLSSKVTSITNVSGLSYKCNGTHPVKEITLGGSSVTFTPSASGVNSWSWGEGPTSSDSSSTTNSGSTTNSSSSSTGGL